MESQFKRKNTLSYKNIENLTLKPNILGKLKKSLSVKKQLFLKIGCLTN